MKTTSLQAFIPSLKLRNHELCLFFSILCFFELKFPSIPILITRSPKFNWESFSSGQKGNHFLVGRVESLRTGIRQNLYRENDFLAARSARERWKAIEAMEIHWQRDKDGESVKMRVNTSYNKAFLPGQWMHVLKISHEWNAAKNTKTRIRSNWNLKNFLRLDRTTLEMTLLSINLSD